MAEGISNDTPRSGWFSRALIILILAALLVPHSLGFSWYSGSMSFHGVSLLAVCWVLVRQDYYLSSESGNSTLLQFPHDYALDQAIMILALFFIVIYLQSRFMRGLTSRNMTLLFIVIALAVQVGLINGSFVIFGNGTYVQGTFPFPVFYILNLVALFWQRGSKSIGLERR